jgi:hypothetical protein
MKLKDALSNLSDITIDNDFVLRLEKMYDTTLPEDIKRVISINKDTMPYDDFSLLRGLSHAEIEEASGDMAVDFIENGLLPVFDVGDNDYIVFDIREKVWYRYNIVDEVKFCKVFSLLEYFHGVE